MASSPAIKPVVAALDGSSNKAAPALNVMALAVLCALGAYASGAHAQSPEAAAPAAKEALDQVIVTGSRIRGVAPVGSTIVSVTRADIESSGAVSTAQLLQETPQVFNLGVSENSRGQSGGSGNITYGSSVNLRGIGPYATLTLINGHRAVSQGTTGAAIDPSIIPTLMLERVEIVADGASAIYGSDAVAGVVNLIQRRKVQGAEAMVRYGSADGYDERQVGAIWGNTWKGGQVTVALQNEYHSALSGRDRDFFAGDLTAFGGGDFRSTQCAPGNIVISGVSYAIPAGGVTAANAAALKAGTTNKCDNLKYADLIPRQERDSAAFTFNQELGHGISLYADGFATRRQYSLLPALLASNLTVPSTNPWYVRPVGAPAGSSETVAYSFGNELPQNMASGYSKSREVTIGADIALGDAWKAGVLYTYGKNDDLAQSTHGLNNAAIIAALASTDKSKALNPFGSSVNSPDVLAAISNNLSISPGTTIFKNYQIKADGPLFSIPGGKVRAAFGYERQDVHTEGGQTTGPATAPATGNVVLTRTIDSVYGELLVPVVGTGNALPGIYKLDLDIAARRDKYSDVGATTNPKLGMNWSPLKSVTVHASYGESFRAPGLTQIRGFANSGRGGLYVQNYSDPTNNGALRVGVALSAPSPDLKPETAKTKSLGVSWEPAFLPRTKLSLSYFDVIYENQVTGYLSDLTVLNREAQFAGTGVIVRNPSAAQVAALTSQYAVQSGVLPSTWTLFVDGRNKNLGRSVSRGVDFQASTKIPTENWGSFGLGLGGTVFTKYQVALTPGAEMTDQLNYIFNPLRFKARGSLNWHEGQWYTNLYVNYQNAYKNNLANPVQPVSSNTTVDARLAYDFDGERFSMLNNTTLALGVVNLFDRKPPFVNLAQSNNGGGGFDPTLTNPAGRIISLTLNKKF
ncbi:MAG: TonB-dependent receptor [Pseudomonadota bacterium]